ncbi:siderophore-iron reductase FhuF [Bradyrhizobium diversitatis]|uniref:Siderophore-iron reductase FhuF n=1 Tax=Bradyrhizobium diversitatis TaxID=2755406 RepID=A0ABS0P5R0_9BRAD|nr:siderophore-iron reductase FhuF [Bradyrhizobium diversitatis]MBH5388589.1 siderophore-iron reductase FhuF [Bradyrhizobium diversitatis]
MTPDEVCEAIDRLAVGDYASFGGRLVGPQDSRQGISAGQLLDAPMREAIRNRFSQRFATFDLRAVQSIWMKWYLNAFIPPVLLADVLLGQSVSVDLSRLRFIIADDGRVEAVRIDRTRDSSREEPFQRLRPLLFEHFAPLIEMWCDRTDVTARVFWSNVGNTFEAMLCRIEAVSGPSARLSEARRWLSEPVTSTSEPNPLFDAVHYVLESGSPERRRRVCCLQYLLPDRRFCKACPIEEARAARRQEGA